MPVSYTHLDVYKRQVLTGTITVCESRFQRESKPRRRPQTEQLYRFHRQLFACAIGDVEFCRRHRDTTRKPNTCCVLHLCVCVCVLSLIHIYHLARKNTCLK